MQVNNVFYFYIRCYNIKIKNITIMMNNIKNEKK